MDEERGRAYAGRTVHDVEDHCGFAIHGSGCAPIDLPRPGSQVALLQLVKRRSRDLDQACVSENGGGPGRAANRHVDRAVERAHGEAFAEAVDDEGPVVEHDRQMRAVGRVRHAIPGPRKGRERHLGCSDVAGHRTAGQRTAGPGCAGRRDTHRCRRRARRGPRYRRRRRDPSRHARADDRDEPSENDGDREQRSTSFATPGERGDGEDLSLAMRLRWQVHDSRRERPPLRDPEIGVAHHLVLAQVLGPVASATIRPVSMT